MKQVIVLERSDLLRLKDGETIQLTPTLLLSVERNTTTTARGPRKPRADRGTTYKTRQSQRLVLNADGTYHCPQCNYTTASIPQMRGHLGGHARHGGQK